MLALTVERQGGPGPGVPGIREVGAQDDDYGRVLGPWGCIQDDVEPVDR
jgi:hypothetical protein